MKSVKLPAFLLIAAIACYFIFQNRAAPFNQNTFDQPDTLAPEQIIGTFSFDSVTHVSRVEGFQHASFLLDKNVNSDVIGKLVEALDTSKVHLLTLKFVHPDSENILKEITDGEFDEKIRALTSALSSRSAKVLVRCNPEMEVPVQTYPWQYQSPDDYNNAFRYLAELFRKELPGVRIVWGAAGYPGVEEYWPGGEYADYTSIVLGSPSESLTNAYPKDSNLTEVIRRKLHRLRFMHKPTLVLAASMQDTTGIYQHFTTAATQINKEKYAVYGVLDSVQHAKHSRRTLQIGAYDPLKSLLKIPELSVEHIFVDLGNIQNGTFKKDFDSIMQRNHHAIVTVEPWRDLKTRKSKQVLENVVNGVYDQEFRTVFDIVSKVKHTVYLRFAHEMEIPIHRYGWQSQDPVLYIRAFRHFMQLAGTLPPHVKRVWGPAGDRGSLEWWPGGDVVDYISIAIYGLPDKNITDPARQESFGDIYKRKYLRVKMVNTPLFITEFGVKGPEDFQSAWLNKAAGIVNQHPEIHGISYFNLADNPEVWGKMPPPDWAVTTPTFQQFVRRLK